MFFAVVSCHAGSMTQILFINDRIFMATHICGWLRAVTKTRCSHPQPESCVMWLDQNATTMKWHKWGKGSYEHWNSPLQPPALTPHRVELQLDNNRTLVHWTPTAIAALLQAEQNLYIILLSSLTHDDICFSVHSKLLHNTQLCDAIYRRYWSHRIQSRDRNNK